MKIVIVGAGATGAFLGARMARAGVDVTLVARGAHLAAMRERGVEVREADETIVAQPPCTDDLSVVTGADAVILTLKAHSLPEIAPRLGPLLGPDTAVVTAQNGIPWWYFERHGGPLDGTRLRTVDPGGVIAGHIDAQRVVGCVVYPATSLVGPGVVEHVEGTRLSLGELDGTSTDRCRAIAGALIKGGLKAPIRPRIRQRSVPFLMGSAGATFLPFKSTHNASM